MTELDPRLERWIAPLRRLPEPRAEAFERLRAAIRRGAAPRAVVLSPAAAVAAAFVIVALTSLGWRTALREPGLPEADGRVPVQFVLHAPEARSVTVVGDFNDWDPRGVAMTRAGDGVWSAVLRLPPGAVRYSFLVDGHDWRADANAAAAPGDFGRPSSIALIGRAGAEL